MDGACTVGGHVGRGIDEQTVLNKVKGTGASLEGANMTGAKATSADFEKAAAARELDADFTG